MFSKKVITRLTSNDEKPYLIRYSIFSCKWFAIKIHKILISDDDCLHDHPWAFITFILKGGYVEHTTKGSKVYGRFSLLYRHLYHKHRLEIHQPAWTLVVTFKKKKSWGFFTKNGWVEWFKYRSTGGC